MPRVGARAADEQPNAAQAVDLSDHFVAGPDGNLCDVPGDDPIARASRG